MYEAKVIEHFSDVPVFRLGDVSQIVENREYAKKFLQRMVRQGRLKKIKKDFYTIHEDPFLVSTFLIKPSYVSSVSALSFHHLITQIPKEVFCFTTKQSKTINFISGINFVHTKYFFGFKHVKHEKIYIPIATPEKAIIDSIGIVPFSVFDEAFEKIDIEQLIDYLKTIKKSSIVKRIGYLAEKNGFDVYEKLKKFINNKYIFLDPIAKRYGKKNKKWKVVVNG
jgi:predicted transcriptional regulator of viral defense system